jgi:GrpB-like predicted nucleotidyltransferase (UPF0157 family)
MRHDPVVIADYSAEWPRAFESEAQGLRRIFAPERVQIEHVGSTAVPGMGAKPIVDILLGASSLRAIERCIPRLAADSYEYVPQFEAVLPLRRYFSKPSRANAVFHLHAVEVGGDFWREQLAFRDVLRSERRLFDEYLALKRALAARYTNDVDAYCDAKAPFIQSVLRERLSRDAVRG